MEVIAAAASILAIAKATLKVGGVLLDKFNAYRHAQAEIFEYIVQYHDAWLRVQEQIHILECLVHSLDETLLRHFDDQLTILKEKLTTSASRLDRVTKRNGNVASKSFSLAFKEPLKQAVNELEQWTKRFEPSWFSTARTMKDSLSRYVPPSRLLESPASHSLEALRKSLELNREDAFDDAVILPRADLLNRRSLPYSSAMTANDPDNKFREVMIDGVESSEHASEFVLDVKDIESLARKLRIIEDPVLWGLLRCRGITKVQDDHGSTVRCLYVFEAPPGLSRPCSLRDLLCSRKAPSLNERIELAKTLARSVLFVHNLKFVHKNIRPETVLTFNVESNPDHRTTFLTGFESFRLADGPTHQSQKQQWERDLYRHPSRQGIRPQVRYAMQHDMYSLGVCLLEIGLWISLVDYSIQNAAVQKTPASILDIKGPMEQRDQTSRAYEIKSVLFRLAHNLLPARMGAKYLDVVKTCLTSWEDGGENISFGLKEEFADSDGVLEAVRYSEKILLKLEEIVL
ncbi:MAG: hypothetical protein M1828_005628 [Chrysothrix sp. TS-e1954]|nr:MAG: hypothetical protein M1828_005628 [Chrysothrix sp. TS-e1954]